MRKDVKLGFAIGGVLLAVLIVYVLVVPGGGDKRLSSATGGGAAQTGNGGGVSLTPVDPPAATATQPMVQAPPPAAPPQSFTPPPVAGGTDPFERPEPVASSNDGGKAKDIDWSKLLNDSDLLMVTPQQPAGTPVIRASSEGQPAANAQDTGAPTPDITKPGPTPIAQQSPSQQAPAPAAPEEPAPANNTETAGTTTGDDAVAADNTTVANTGGQSTSAGNTNVPQPPPPVVVADPPMPGSLMGSGGAANTGSVTAETNAAGQKVHVVQAGETYSTISLIAYGNPNLYSAIMRANPGIEPQRLRPGMKIVVPPLAQARPPVATPVSGATAQLSSSRVEQPVDPRTQYRVQSGDSLYSIAKKLYGRGDRSTRLYEANRASIGDDMNNIKVGQVLTLPEPPASAAATPAAAPAARQ